MLKEVFYLKRKEFAEQIEALILKNQELYNDNVALSHELENKKALVKELQDEIEKLKLENAELAENSVSTFKVLTVNELADAAEAVEENIEPEASVDNEINQEEPEQNTNAPVIPENIDICADVDENIVSASSVIGKIVLECAELCNLFTKEGGQNAKDLVNLALGRTEVFKSEILQLVTENEDFNDAKTEVNLKVASIREYFDLLKKQL